MSALPIDSINDPITALLEKYFMHGCASARRVQSLLRYRRRRWPPLELERAIIVHPGFRTMLANSAFFGWPRNVFIVSWCCSWDFAPSGTWR